jgi:hypothetical protein
MAVPIAAAVVSLVATAGPVLAAETGPPAGTASVAIPSAGPFAEHARQLHELRSPKRGLRLYTLSDIEAKQAEVLHGFISTDESKGIGMYNKAVDESLPVHRLRMVGELPRYILVSDEDELEKLRYDTTDPWEFTYEGVVGWVLREETPGTIPLHRYSRKNEWRAARAARADLLEAGFTDDGLLGFAPVPR